MSYSEKNVFKERERALENEFFYKVDQQLIENLQKEIANEQLKVALAMHGRISGELLLDELVQLGVKPESLVAVHLVPLVLVAWADHHVEEKERITVLQAAEKLHISEGTPAHRLLEHWLRKEPGPLLAAAWEHYIEELCGRLTPAGRKNLCSDVMGRAAAVAKSAHGILGFGRIAPEEKQILQELEDAFRS